MTRPDRADSPAPLNIVIAAEGAFYVITALWPLLHFSSFESLVGPKPDRFQFFATDLLVLVIGAALLAAALPPTPRNRPGRGIFLLAVGVPIAFMTVEIWFRHTLPLAFAVDFAVEAVFVILLVWLRLGAGRMGKPAGKENGVC